MPRRRSLLPIQVLLFLLVTLLGVATGNLTNGPGLEFLRRQSLPLAAITLMLIVGVMFWQHRAEQHPHPPDWDPDRSPFPGLEAFTEQDSAVFFGRDAETAELLDRLHPVVAAQANRLVAVVGPSGTGKSSLVQAGVVPRLRRRRGGWIVAPALVPGDEPLRNLTRSLRAAGVERTTENMSVPDLVDELRAAARRPNAPVLLIVDQAEELVTLSGQTERDRFLGLLADALDADPRLWIILILRSEFLTAFLGTEQARLFRNPVMVGALGRAELVGVIEQPARRAGLTFDPPSLPQRMAADAGGGDALPLLAYALQELCLAAGPARVLTADAYRRVGGVTGVLTRQADKVAAEVAGADGAVLSTLLQFVTISENEPTRRRVRLCMLTESQRQVAEAFTTARLLTTDTDGNDTVLDVAHEALFRTWAPLRQAIEGSADRLRLRADLERGARDWDSSGRQESWLLRDERLRAAQHWAAAQGDMTGLDLVAEFLACSNRADRATMRQLSETIARRALSTVDSDPDYGLVLALAAFEECAPTALALRALTASMVASQVRVVLRGHDDWVFRVAWSPDGGRLATVSADRTARIWNAGSCTELAVLRGHSGEIRGLSWSPDGRRLATGSRDRTARIWDTDSWTELAVLRGHDDGVRAAAWSPDGRWLATASADHTARIWDTDSWTELAVLHGHDGWLQGVSWSPDGRRLATGSRDRTARIWDTDSWTELAVLRGHDDGVRAAAWSPDGRWLATASADRTTRIWDTDSWTDLAMLSGHDGWVTEVEWSPDGRRLATASVDRTIRIWDAGSRSEIMTLRGHEDEVRDVTWSPDSTQLATASADRTVRIWDATSPDELLLLHGHHGSIHDVAWSPDGRRLATASYDRTARVWDAGSAGELVVLRGHHDVVRRVAWSPDGQRLATTSEDGTTVIWDPDSGSERVRLRTHHDGIRGVAWSPDGKRVATASADQTSRIWDTDDGSEILTLHCHEEVWAVAWSPDSTRLATTSDGWTARIWDADSGSEILALRGHDDWVRWIAWSPDGRRLATASADRTARVWDADSGSEILTLHGHDDEVHGVAWSPDGQRLATADRTVRIWDAESGAEIIVVGAHAKGVESVAWSPDGSRIASASRDGTCRIWDATISIEQLVANAHRRACRELTAEERHNLMLPSTAQVPTG